MNNPSKIIFSPADKQKTIARYSKLFNRYSHSQKALGWGEKGKQELRFKVLVDYWNLKGMRILDIGAGFGDLYQFLQPYKIKNYHGFELVRDLAQKGIELYGTNDNFKMSIGNFLEIELVEEYDIAFISGLFNFKLVNGNNDEFIRSVITKAFRQCRVGLASNFITDRVDYEEELIFNSRPETILEMGLALTRNVLLRCDYFPFEFSLFLTKDDSFSKEDTIFNTYKNKK